MKLKVALFAAALLVGCQSRGEPVTNLSSIVTGKTLDVEAWGEMSYRADGSYFYKDSRGDFNGKYRIEGNKVCIESKDKLERCDRYFRRNGEIYMVNHKGNSFRIEKIE